MVLFVGGNIEILRYLISRPIIRNEILLLTLVSLLNEISQYFDISILQKSITQNHNKSYNQKKAPTYR